MALKKLVAGNWKMHGTGADLAEVNAISLVAETAPCDVALCLPATLIERAVRAAPGFAVGGQDCHFADMGAHTGDISAGMLKEAGASLTIVGHSERRENHGESDAVVRAKAETAIAQGLSVILCVGESLEIREAGRAVEVVSAQVDASLPHAATGKTLAVAYEPIWAIGTGKVPSADDIAEMHAALRDRLVAAYGDGGQEIRILYGGSVKATNAAEIFAIANVDGALVGGASLKAADFLPIIAAGAA
jgi:triosephosphate isomerase